MKNELYATDKGDMNLQGRKSLFPLNLQLFGEEGGDGDNSGAGVTEPKEPPTEPKTYTQEEYEKALQSEADKRVTEALKTAQEKWKAEYEKQLEEEKSEAKRMAKLSEEEKAKELLKKERENFEKEKRALESEKLEIEVRRNLREQGLDDNFAPFLMGENAEKSLENIGVFKEAFTKAVEVAVKEQLKGTPPSAGGGSKTTDPFLQGFNS